MTRVVDRSARGSFMPSLAGSVGRFQLNTASVNKILSFPGEVSFGFYCKTPVQVESLWNVYPAWGISRLNTGVSGFNVQRSGGVGVAKGVPYANVASNSVSFSASPNGNPGTPSTGTLIGWQHCVVTISLTTICLYTNGRPTARASYTYGAGGIDAPSLDILFNVGWARGYNGALHHTLMTQAAIFNSVLTAEEVHDWYFRDAVPSRGIVCLYDADDFVGTLATLLDKSRNLKHIDSLVNVGKSMESPA